LTLKAMRYSMLHFLHLKKSGERIGTVAHTEKFSSVSLRTGRLQVEGQYGQKGS
jgi:hypothetical protein